MDMDNIDDYLCLSIDFRQTLPEKKEGKSLELIRESDFVDFNVNYHSFTENRIVIDEKKEVFCAETYFWISGYFKRSDRLSYYINNEKSAFFAMKEDADFIYHSLEEIRSYLLLEDNRLKHYSNTDFEVNKEQLQSQFLNKFKFGQSYFYVEEVWLASDLSLIHI